MTASAGAIIRRHSKSFALASLLLEPGARRDAHALYAYCRRADDAIDDVPASQARGALQVLHGELDAVYRGGRLSDTIPAEFQRVVIERRIPRAYPEALLEGFELDVAGAGYASVSELHHYCWCVAGSVGAMMCHVLGVRSERAVIHGVHLGMAMQLTNICRDVAEDWARGRLYLPAELLQEGAVPRDWPPSALTQQQLSRAVARLLEEASVFYRSGDAGLDQLAFRSRVAVATARHVYSSIGAVLLERGVDVTAGRAFVRPTRKLRCVARALVEALRARPAQRELPARLPEQVVRFPEHVLPI